MTRVQLLARHSPLATSIESVIVPTYEVPRTAPPTEEDAENPAFSKLAGLVLDMKLLAEANAKKLSKMLEPLVTAYKDWIQREETKLNDPKQGLEQFGDASRVSIDNCRLTLNGSLLGFIRVHDGTAAIAGDRCGTDRR